MTLRRWAAAAVVAVLAAGCSSASSGGGFPSASPNPKRSELLARADLDPCPPSSAAPTSGGLPDVTLPCLGRGPAVHLAGVRGKPLVLNIWGSWCGPCQKETPLLARMYDELKGRVRFLGVDTEEADPNSALDFAAHVRPRMRYPSVLDDDKQVLLGLHLPSAVPSTVFVTATGHVAHVSAGPYLSARQLADDITRYLGVSA